MVSSPFSSMYITPSAFPLRCTIFRTQQLLRSEKLFRLLSTGMMVFVGCALAPIMQP